MLADGDRRQFIDAHPKHPYAEVGADGVAAALRWLRTCFSEDGYRYVTAADGANHVLPGPLGAPRRSALVPATMAAGALSDPAPICVVGIPALRDFPAVLCAANIAARGHEARAVVVDLDVGRVEANAVTLARRFDDPAFRAAFADGLAPLLRDGERVGMPAVLGLRDPHGVWTDLQERLGRPVFEIPTLPPSAPGVRLFDALRRALRAGGGMLTMGARVIPSDGAGQPSARTSAATSAGTPRARSCWRPAGWRAAASNWTRTARLRRDGARAGRLGRSPLRTRRLRRAAAGARRCRGRARGRLRRRRRPPRR